MERLSSVTVDDDMCNRNLKHELDEADAEACGKTELVEMVSGGKYTIFDLPRHEMLEDEMPREIVHRMIKNNLLLDSSPMLNLASFVTTYMEEEAEDLMIDALNKNFIDHDSYPVTLDIQTRCVNIIAQLFHAPIEADSGNATGTSTIGSSEAIMLAVLAMKKRWVKRQKEAGKDYSQPNIIMSSAVQVCWKKAARYFDIDERYVYCIEDCYTIDPDRAVDLADENTIGICSILGTTYTGEYEDTKAINDLLVKRDIDIPIHVDAASGGFVTPFTNPELLWDFRLEKVVSINVSGHKYGLVYAGIGWVIWRSAAFLPEELIFDLNYLGTDQASFTLNFSRSASQIIGQYYQLVRLGKKGYRSIMRKLTFTADYLAQHLQRMGFILVSKVHGRGLPMVAFRLDPAQNYRFDEFAVAAQLRKHGWVVPAYSLPPHSESRTIMRVVVRGDLTPRHCDTLITHLASAMQELDMMGEIKRESATQSALVHSVLHKRWIGSSCHLNQTDETSRVQQQEGLLG